MKSILVAAATLVVSSIPALAQSSNNMTCSHFGAMNTADQMAAVDSMHSGMAADNRMSSGGNTAANAATSPSDHMSTQGTAKEVATICHDHPDMKVEDAMHNAMAH